ncbi:peptidyl-prolyl cis-trans isomerase [Vibrio kyushuensis]|uniref:peptidylprolyl isomerase n=1 Tax=Vibrio kyushuensis TaxID=2910249 RepID=UPI003D0D73E8
MIKLFKQPLIHFLFAGVLLFVVFGQWGSEGFDENSGKIIVDKNSLLTFMQYRAKAFDKQRFEQQLSNMNAENKQRLIGAMIREEALYREAKRLGLEQNDYIIKQRLLQKLEFINQGFNNAMIDIQPQQVDDFYNQYKDIYTVPSNVTFTHVYFDKDKLGGHPAREIAEKTRLNLNLNKVHFTDGFTHGDRFPYHVNYIEKDQDFIQSHFGGEFAQKLFTLAANEELWFGPIASNHGQHLVMISNITQERVPPLTEIQRVVHDDLHRQLLQKATDSANQNIIDSYEVKISDELLTPDQSMNIANQEMGMGGMNK